MNFKTVALEVMEGKKSGRSFLRALSYLYQIGVTARHFAYDNKLFKSSKIKIPVVSIGNIVAGGTGKTPLVRFLSEVLLHDLKVAILSRGYRSEVEKLNFVMKISSDGNPQKCGDEPFWLSQVLPKAAVWVGKNRLFSAFLAQEAGAQVIILDDGMQYRKLERDVEIVVMDGQELFGSGYFLPRGMLRDTPHRLKKAQLIVVNQAKDFDHVQKEIARYTQAPIVFVRMRSNVDFKGKKVGVFCAIGRPERFIEAVRHCGSEVVATYLKIDHDPFSIEELNDFAATSGAELLVCTEKDQVKLPQDFQCKLPIHAMQGKMEIVGGSDHWKAMIEKIKMKVSHEWKTQNYSS